MRFEQRRERERGVKERVAERSNSLCQFSARQRAAALAHNNPSLTPALPLSRVSSWKYRCYEEAIGNRACEIFSTCERCVAVWRETSFTLPTRLPPSTNSLCVVGCISPPLSLTPSLFPFFIINNRNRISISPRARKYEQPAKDLLIKANFSWMNVSLSCKREEEVWI